MTKAAERWVWRRTRLAAPAGLNHNAAVMPGERLEAWPYVF
jgi:hypothetical protein